MTTNGSHLRSPAPLLLGVLAGAMILAAPPLPLRAQQPVVDAAVVRFASQPSVDPAAPAGLPFRSGERLTYRASMPILGRIGTGTMSVEAESADGGSPVLLLGFDFAGRAGLFRLADTTRSWVEPHGFAALRFEKREDSPLGARREAVRIDRAARRWTAADGTSGELPTDSPLDELSFLFYVRTLPLEPGAVYRVMRHFDARRNPVTFRVVRRENVKVPAGEFASIVVEMKVTDRERYGGEGTILLHLSDDALRVPLRIASAVPGAGRITFSLEAADTATAAVVGISLTSSRAGGGDPPTR